MPAAPADGGPRRWQVTAHDGLPLHRGRAADTPVIATLSEGAVLSNLGCQLVEDRVWCRVQPLQQRTQGYVQAEHLGPAQGPDGSVPMGKDDSRERARRGDFDATGSIPCAQNPGEPLSECQFGVARGTGGDATVVATFSNGFKRLLFFAHGLFISGDTTMSGNGFDTDWRVEGDLHIIRVDDQRYELPGSAIFGES